MSYQQLSNDDLNDVRAMGGLANNAASSFLQAHKGEAIDFLQAHKGEAIDFATEKAIQLKKMVEEGDSSWKYLGFIAGVLIMCISFMGFLSSLFGFAPVLALLYVYFFCAGALMAALEFKDSFIPTSYREQIRKEALFLYRPYGRASFYFGVGILLVSLGGVITPLIGIYTAAVGIYIYFGSVGALKTLNALREQSNDEEMMRRKFAEADRDGSGYIMPEELAVVCTALGTTLKKNELETAVFLLDKNDDGKISYEEFRSWWLERA